jgi:hypothetical protein
MNETVNKLMKQAGTDVSGKWMSIDNTEKFAELLIKECMSNLYLNGYDDAVVQIKEHFGIA